MERLRSSDPARIAGHRLLGRLGAGGMGVVYLARTTAGSLVALKVLAAEYAEDAGFRERFRREVEVARRVDSPWAVPLVDADPDAEAPWLATAYVPGPSLAEAVTSYGPLDEHGLRVLGGRLAMALGEVHKAGLVHRDLKPGNVLLAPDGPRLIDFGIARAPEDHSLTATGFVVGTPGYLAPEQADERGGHAVGGPSDVFSLGCVLAFAATGRPPFGTGALDALLYRAVHDAADLDGVPAALAGLLSRCLAKDPALRPEVSQIVGELQPDEPSDDAPASWLPEEVVALIARRSTEALALPEIEHTEIAGGASPAGTSAAATAPADGARVRTGSRSTASVDDTAAPASGTDDTRPTAAADAPAPPRGAAPCSSARVRCSPEEGPRPGGPRAGTTLRTAGNRPPPAAPRTPSRSTVTSAGTSAPRARPRSTDCGWPSSSSTPAATPPSRWVCGRRTTAATPPRRPGSRSGSRTTPPCSRWSVRPRTRPPRPRWRPTTPPSSPCWRCHPAPSPCPCRGSARSCTRGCPTRCCPSSSTRSCGARTRAGSASSWTGRPTTTAGRSSAT
ncbi:serine/threonine protein kinase [Streptomyces sp. LBUM 1487]|nr:serine/threonine protein kinase [Streptomyces sp. LBUM 1487]